MGPFMWLSRLGRGRRGRFFRSYASGPSVPPGTTPRPIADRPKYGWLPHGLDQYALPSSEPHSTRVPMGAPSGHGTVEVNEAQFMASMAANELGPMLTATEVAAMLHLHVNTVKRLGDRGELPFYRVCKRGDRRFRMEDVMQFLTKNR